MSAVPKDAMDAPVPFAAHPDSPVSAYPGITLDDKYLLDHGRVFMTGTQALVRLPMIQRQRDLAAGLNTAGFISGYRGSPLGALTRRCGKRRNS